MHVGPSGNSNTLTVDVSPSGNGNIKIDQSVASSYPYQSTVESGAQVILEAVPNPGYVFKNWSGDVSGTTNPTTIVVNGTKTVTANFSPVTHILTVKTSGNGSTTPAVGAHDYVEAAVVTIEAIPDSGWRFDNWTGDVADTRSTTTNLTMASDKTVTANFSPVTHILTVKTSGNGSTTPAVGAHDYVEAAVVTIEAIPDSGWRFDNWTGDVADTRSATTNLTMASDKTVTANFSKKGLTLVGLPLAGWVIGGLALVGLPLFMVLTTRRKEQHQALKRLEPH